MNNNVKIWLITTEVIVSNMAYISYNHRNSIYIYNDIVNKTIVESLFYYGSFLLDDPPGVICGSQLGKWYPSLGFLC